jgi:hypothetical protein
MASNVPGYSIHTFIVKTRLSLWGLLCLHTKKKVCKPLQKQQNDVCRYFMIGHAFLQQHAWLNIIVGLPMFTMTFSQTGGSGWRNFIHAYAANHWKRSHEISLSSCKLEIKYWVCNLQLDLYTPAPSKQRNRHSRIFGSSKESISKKFVVTISFYKKAYSPSLLSTITLALNNDFSVHPTYSTKK